ncbi:hypothetical protein [Sporosarcina limicola]|uniref:Membrane protein n=1 Tax=Sporosarcina limicola TaxID=34101 RepID=A0A927MGZ9_9BACL|nr:hypothetical protein [Sporosarcina limicola]MBE1554245.1 putative membrane protein [Sporosarcina limicola]
MGNWKQALSLAKFELRNSKKALVLLGFLLITYVFFIVYSVPIYFKTGFVLFDLFFLMITGMAAMWAKPKGFQMKKVENNLTVTPYFVMLHQLPIPKEILIKNRFIIYYAYAVPLHTLFLALIYVFSETMRAELTFPQYIAFSLIWISFGIYWGTIYPVTELGEVSGSSNLKAYLYLILYLVIISVGITLLQVYTGSGIIYWSMNIAKKWPLLSSILSVAAAGLSTILWLRAANKKIKRIDYSI